MDKHEFLNKLSRGLKNVPADEKQNALNYYNEYFDDAGAENEAAVIAELQHPNKIAAQITAEYIGRDIEQTRGSGKRAVKSVWFVVAAIFALPIGLPIALSAVVVVVALLFTAFMVLLSFAITTVACVAAGIALFIVGVYLLFFDATAAFLCIGQGMMGLGLGVLLYYPFKSLLSLLIKGLRRVARRMLNRGEGYEAGKV